MTIKRFDMPEKYDTNDDVWEGYFDKLEGYDVWYWYQTGSYDGQGGMVLRKDGKWYFHDLGHCSCYGPMEELEGALQDGSETWRFFRLMWGLRDNDEALLDLIEKEL